MRATTKEITAKKAPAEALACDRGNTPSLRDVGLRRRKFGSRPRQWRHSDGHLQPDGNGHKWTNCELDQVRGDGKTIAMPDNSSFPRSGSRLREREGDEGVAAGGYQVLFAGYFVCHKI